MWLSYFVFEGGLENFNPFEWYVKEYTTINGNSYQKLPGACLTSLIKEDPFNIMALINGFTCQGKVERDAKFILPLNNKRLDGF